MIIKSKYELNKHLIGKIRKLQNDYNKDCINKNIDVQIVYDYIVDNISNHEEMLNNQTMKFSQETIDYVNSDEYAINKKAYDYHWYWTITRRGDEKTRSELNKEHGRKRSSKARYIIYYVALKLKDKNEKITPQAIYDILKNTKNKKGISTIRRYIKILKDNHQI